MILVTLASALLTVTPAPQPSAYCGAEIQLKSWKGDFLHRPDSAQGVTSWGTGVGNEWALQVVP
jgi:hypothetical protein